MHAAEFTFFGGIFFISFFLYKLTAILRTYLCRSPSYFYIQICIVFMDIYEDVINMDMWWYGYYVLRGTCENGSGKAAKHGTYCGEEDLIFWCKMQINTMPTCREELR